MRLSDILSEINIRDSKDFFVFTEKWIGYVTSKKKSSDISENDWKEMFGRRNPAAGIDWGEMQDVAKTPKGVLETNEQKSFKNNWDSAIRPAIEDAINTNEISEKLSKIKHLRNNIQNIIKDGGGRERATAINRMLTTFFPNLFVTIPQPAKLVEFIHILQKSVENGNSIKETDNWVDNSYQVRKFLEKEFNNEKKIVDSAWRFYDYLKADNPKQPKPVAKMAGSTYTQATPTPKPEKGVGYCYIITNPAFQKNYLKIGYTDNLERRLNDLYNTSVPARFEVYAALKTTKYKEAEELMHKTFEGERIGSDREFFLMLRETALDFLRVVAKGLGGELIVFGKDGKPKNITNY